MGYPQISAPNPLFGGRGPDSRRTTEFRMTDDQRLTTDLRDARPPSFLVFGDVLRASSGCYRDLALYWARTGVHGKSSEAEYSLR